MTKKNVEAGGKAQFTLDNLTKGSPNPIKPEEKPITLSQVPLSQGIYKPEKVSIFELKVS